MMTRALMDRKLLFILLLCSFIRLNNVEEASSTTGLRVEDIYSRAEDLIANLKKELDQLRHSFELTSLNQTERQAYPSSCLAALINSDAIQTIEVAGLKPFAVYCDTSTVGAGWTVIQRRRDGSENFYRSWSEYQKGFGKLSGEFFIGLDKLHAMTNHMPHELYVHLEDFEGTSHYAKYEHFVVGNETDAYTLRKLGKYVGDAGDSLRYHEGMPFSTFDNDRKGNRCAIMYVGAWWYNSCQHSNLNGQYIEGGRYGVKLSGRGICWKSWRGYDYGYKLTQMMIRPRCLRVSS